MQCLCQGEWGDEMATRKREQSESGFYHVFQRGVNHFDIFEDDSDREFYVEKMRKYAAKSNVEIHAWCLMGNHVHMLLRAGIVQLSAMMRQLGSVYARFFNFRHSRSGPLFEGRFCSVCVETDAQLLSVVRYIHRNPIHHEERTLYGDYPWSSYGEYLAGGIGVCEVELAMSLFGSMAEFIRFHEAEFDGERHLDVGSTGLMGDDEARMRANRALERAGFKVATSQVGALAHELRDDAVRLLKRMVGCSIRQIQRLTSISYSAIRKAVEASDIALATSAVLWGCDGEGSSPLFVLVGAYECEEVRVT